MDEINAIIQSDLPDVEKLAQTFDWITSRIVEHAQQEIELRRAMQDHESLVKEQIKMETIKFTRGIFQENYKRITGRSAWDE